MTRPIFGCIEAGGTKFVLGAVCDDGTIVCEGRVPTTSPDETLGAAIDFFKEAASKHGPFAAFGIASFGPVELDRRSPRWGYVAKTPKPGWSGADLIGRFASAFDCAVGFDTDVNGAVLSESLWGAAAGADIAAYITVGTGIGGGALVEGRPVHGLRHPEMGHLIVRRHAHDRDFGGTCPFHGDCLEGLASGPAIMARWGASLSELGDNDVAHDVIAFYLAQLVVAQQAILSPQRVVMGGGVMATPGLLGRVREHARRLAAGYFGTDDYEGLVVAPGLGDRAGLLGALALAQQALA